VSDGRFVGRIREGTDGLRISNARHRRSQPAPGSGAAFSAATDPRHTSESALFALVEGTDPELILAIEARDDGHWRFAAGRLTRWRSDARRYG